MIRLGGPEIIILLAIVILLFGAGRIAKIGRELGTGIRSFREAITGSEKASGEEDK
ncbi:MAG: twin-arginine translocase TatA/TatE family subunit [Chloroflexota bacterium]|nr:MAG: twin-arginine translocase TatA/TatE family subunit [Chloroflexota bacterium]